MSIFDNILGNWIQIIDEKNDLTIESYKYDTGVIEGTTGNHCVKCVAINRCWFKDEVGKKPEKFDLTNINIVNSLLKGVIPGLYHFRCHCREIPINYIGFDKAKEIIDTILENPRSIDNILNNNVDNSLIQSYQQLNKQNNLIGKAVKVLKRK